MKWKLSSVSDPFSSITGDDGVAGRVRVSQELDGERRGSKMIVTADNHIYRRVRSGDKYLGCYFNVITKAMLKLRPDVQRCRGNSDLL